jgi:ferredoxin--NADP+ reductase
MVGLPAEEGRPLMRAYSLAAANYEETLEFLSIKVQDGPLTSRLQHLKAGDPILIGRKPTGTLIVDNLLPGKTLWLLSTGTGLAPFLSVIKDPEVYERFEHVIVTHTCRFHSELAYRDYIRKTLPADEILGELIGDKLTYYPTVTREPFKTQGRITDLISSGRIFADLHRPAFSPESDRVMICGNPQMLRDTRILLEGAGLFEGSHSRPGHFVVERAFVD